MYLKFASWFTLISIPNISVWYWFIIDLKSWKRCRLLYVIFDSNSFQTLMHFHTIHILISLIFNAHLPELCYIIIQYFAAMCSVYIISALKSWGIPLLINVEQFCKGNMKLYQIFVQYADIMFQIIHLSIVNVVNSPCQYIRLNRG